jgi:glucuronate isomerase
LFRGTPSGVWLAQELSTVFGINEKLNGKSALKIYDAVDKCLKTDAYKPRKLFEKFNIEALCTTDAATDSLEHHQAIKKSGWKGRVLPTFRPDGVINIDDINWKSNIKKLGELTGVQIGNHKALATAIQKRRVFFKQMGAVATDHGARFPLTAELSIHDAEAIFQRAMTGKATAEDAMRFTGHMIMENARMSIEDGLVMQFHVGVNRNHNHAVYNAFGPDKGCDIPIQTKFVSYLAPLLNKYGNDSRLTLVLFTMDESSYARELAPLAGHYPAVKLGPPWWFNDSPNGMARYFDQVMETAGLHNTAGFNDDTRAFPSIPARHDVWRRCACNWIAGMAVKGLVDMDDAKEMALDASYRLAKKVYKFEGK